MTAAEQTIAHLADVPIVVEAELDRPLMTVREILKLAAGSAIRLTRAAGENVDLYVGEVLAGYGEIVVIENNVAVRITDFIE
jgi:flagellar motor switch protein FliN/FliY